MTERLCLFIAGLGVGILLLTAVLWWLSRAGWER